MSKEIEENTILRLDYTKLQQIAKSGCEVIPAVAQDIVSGEVLIIGYVNQQALEAAVAEKKAVFWSTSRNELWIKGKTSGDYLELIETRVNCEQNSVLYRVKLTGKGSCHTKNQNGNSRKGCYYRKITENMELEFIEK